MRKDEKLLHSAIFMCFFALMSALRYTCKCVYASNKIDKAQYDEIRKRIDEDFDKIENKLITEHEAKAKEIIGKGDL